MSNSVRTKDAGEETLRVPFLDLSHVNDVVRRAVHDGLERLFGTSAFVNGPDVERFESAFAAYCGSSHCVGVASGLDALRISLLASGVGPGSEVVVPAQTFVATLEAVTQAGAVPIVVDVDARDYCIDVDAVASAITPRTAAIVPVHLYGQLADMRRLRSLADRAGIAVIEDAAQAHGATRDGLRAGAVGAAAAFSFYPGKNLGALGDAGALTTDDGALAAYARALREHGQRVKYQSDVPGYTARLDTIQAIALHEKLPHLDRWNGGRRAIAARYHAALEGVGDLELPPVASGSDPVWHLYVVRTHDPSSLGEALHAAGIGFGRHYPIPPHLSSAYAHLGYREGSFPVAEALSREGLSLPLFPGMTDAQVGRVCDVVQGFFDG